MTLVGMGPFGLTAFISATSGESTPSYVEYGAFGLCAVLVGWMCKYIYDLRQDSKDANRVLLEIATTNTRAFERWAALLAERPCLVRDRQAIQGDEN